MLQLFLRHLTVVFKVTGFREICSWFKYVL